LLCLRWPPAPNPPAAREPAAPAKTEAPAAQEPAAKDLLDYEDLTVGFIQTGSEGGWRAANTASFKETAEQLGVNLKFYDAQNKLENQLSAFRNFISDEEVDVIILAALETTGWEEVLKEAQKPVRWSFWRTAASSAGRSVCHLHWLLTAGEGARVLSKCASCSMAARRRTSSSWSATWALPQPKTAPGLPRKWASVHHDRQEPDRQLGCHRGKAVMEAC
jgi:hypothetical protein